MYGSSAFEKFFAQFNPLAESGPQALPILFNPYKHGGLGLRIAARLGWGYLGCVANRMTHSFIFSHWVEHLHKILQSNIVSNHSISICSLFITKVF